MDIREFLIARIAEDEALAEASIDAHAPGEHWSVDQMAAVDAAHINQWGPWRVLSACISKRLIVAAHHEVVAVRADGEPEVCCSSCGSSGALLPTEWPCYTLRALAMEYAAHPAYRYEWRTRGLTRAAAPAATLSH